MVSLHVNHAYGCFNSWEGISKAFGRELLKILTSNQNGLCLWPVAIGIAEGNKQWAKDLMQQFEIYQIIFLVEDKGHVSNNVYFISRELLNEYRLY